MAETDDNYVAVRMNVNNRTWKANSYDIVYSIAKEDITKEGAVVTTPGLQAQGRISGSPSTMKYKESIESCQERAGNRGSVFKIIS